MTSLFTQEALSKSVFKWPSLAGKVLSIHVQSSYDRHTEETTTIVFGYEEKTGKCYVLHQEIRRGEEK